MNTPRLAVAATVLVMLCGTAGAETMDKTNNDPLAVPVSGKSLSGERAAAPWTPERQAKAVPKPAPEIDPAAVRAASERLRSGRDGGPEEATAAVVLAAGDGPIGAKPAATDSGPDYWTPERMRKAKPMPTPVIPGGSLNKPDPKNR